LYFVRDPEQHYVFQQDTVSSFYNEKIVPARDTVSFEILIYLVMELAKGLATCKKQNLKFKIKRPLVKSEKDVVIDG
jgi:hypothetical protein